jgi:hypothetical protein
VRIDDGTAGNSQKNRRSARTSERKAGDSGTNAQDATVAHLTTSKTSTSLNTSPTRHKHGVAWFAHTFG